MEGMLHELPLRLPGFGLTREGLNVPLAGDETDEPHILLGDAGRMAPLTGDAMVREEPSGLPELNLFDCESLFDPPAILDPGLVESGELGSCRRRNRLLVSCQNRADAMIPLDPLFGFVIPPLSWTPLVLSEDTLSVSEAVRSQVALDSFKELASGA